MKTTLNKSGDNEMTKHVHHDLIVQWALDTTQVVEMSYGNNSWFHIITPQWNPVAQYRIRHKHQDLIDRKKERPELVVEFYENNSWCSATATEWCEGFEYRLVEPVPVPVTAVPAIPATNIWYEALLDACMVAHIGFNEADPRKTIHDLITWHVQVALDPLVSVVAPAAPAEQISDTDRVLFLAALSEMPTDAPGRIADAIKGGVSKDEMTVTPAMFRVAIDAGIRALKAAAPTKEAT